MCFPDEKIYGLYTFNSQTKQIVLYNVIFLFLFLSFKAFFS